MKRTMAAGLVAAALAPGVVPAQTASVPAPEPLVLPGSQPIAQPALGATLDGLLAYARDHNPDFAALRREADAAAQRVQPAGALPDPVLRATFSDIVNRERGGGINLLPGQVGSTTYLVMQTFPWFGKRDLKREVAELQAQGAMHGSANAWNVLAAGIRSTWAQLFYVTRNERVVRSILELLVQLEQVAQARYAGGLVPQQDVIRAQVEQTTLRGTLLDIERARRIAQAQVNTLVGRPANAPLPEPQALPALPPAAQLQYAALEERLLDGNPQILAEQAKLDAARKSRDLVFRNRYPDVTVGVAPMQERNRIRDWEVMLEVNIPLQQETRRSQESEAQLMISAAEARLHATANLLRSQLAENLAGLEAARSAEQLAASSLRPQAELTFRSALAGYETGRVDFATLLDAQRQIRTARQSEILAQAEAQARLAEVERLTGGIR